VTSLERRNTLFSLPAWCFDKPSLLLLLNVWKEFEVDCWYLGAGPNGHDSCVIRSCTTGGGLQRGYFLIATMLQIGNFGYGLKIVWHFVLKLVWETKSNADAQTNI
jgi:hypothetical protein